MASRYGCESSSSLAHGNLRVIAQTQTRNDNTRLGTSPENAHILDLKNKNTNQRREPTAAIIPSHYKEQQSMQQMKLKTDWRT